jgi:hypothetical protein
LATLCGHFEQKFCAGLAQRHKAQPFINQQSYLGQLPLTKQQARRVAGFYQAIDLFVDPRSQSVPSGATFGQTPVCLTGRLAAPSFALERADQRK